MERGIFQVATIPPVGNPRELVCRLGENSTNNRRSSPGVGSHAASSAQARRPVCPHRAAPPPISRGELLVTCGRRRASLRAARHCHICGANLGRGCVLHQSCSGRSRFRRALSDVLQAHVPLVRSRLGDGPWGSSCSRSSPSRTTFLALLVDLFGPGMKPSKRPCDGKRPDSLNPRSIRSRRSPPLLSRALSPWRRRSPRVA